MTDYDIEAFIDREVETIEKAREDMMQRARDFHLKYCENSNQVECTAEWLLQFTMIVTKKLRNLAQQRATFQAQCKEGIGGK